MATVIITISTMNIIQTKSSLYSFWWKAWLAILLLVFGIPSLVARFVLLPGDAIRTDLLLGEKVSDSDLHSFYKTRRAAASWFHENAVYNDLALATFEMALHNQTGTTKAFLQESALWEFKALNVSPADAYGWYRMAYLYYSAEGPSQRVKQAWGLSMASAPYEPRLALPRLQMALGLGSPFLNEDAARIFVPHLIRDVWEDDRDQLAVLAREGSYISLVEEALRNNPADLASFREKVTHVDSN